MKGNLPFETIWGTKMEKVFLAIDPVMNMADPKTVNSITSEVNELKY
jgi:hypothetical protein